MSDQMQQAYNDLCFRKIERENERLRARCAALEGHALEVAERLRYQAAVGGMKPLVKAAIVGAEQLLRSVLATEQDTEERG